MEDGTLQSQIQAHLKSLDFISSEATLAPPTQVESKYTSRSSTIEALLRQNDDISARLKVAVQKLAQLEDNVESLEEKNKKITASNDGLKDQLLIWKEKERIWLERIAKAEQQVIDLKNSYPKIISMQSEIDRYHKYHEKVKTQVKPYIQQLKEYAKGLSDQIKALNLELEQAENEKSNSQKKISALESELMLQQRAHQSTVENLKNTSNSDLRRLEIEITSLRENNLILESKSNLLDASLSKQDELENEIVTLRRRLGEIREKISSDTEGLRVSLQIARNEILQKNLIIDDYTILESSLKNQTEVQAQENKNLSDQLTSLRFMWTDKCSEFEQTKAALVSLEKLNLELSQRMKDLRSL